MNSKKSTLFLLASGNETVFTAECIEPYMAFFVGKHWHLGEYGCQKRSNSPAGSDTDSNRVSMHAWWGYKTQKTWFDGHLHRVDKKVAIFLHGSAPCRCHFDNDPLLVENNKWISLIDSTIEPDSITSFGYVRRKIPPTGKAKKGRIDWRSEAFIIKVQIRWDLSYFASRGVIFSPWIHKT